MSHHWHQANNVGIMAGGWHGTNGAWPTINMFGLYINYIYYGSDTTLGSLYQVSYLV